MWTMWHGIGLSIYLNCISLDLSELYFGRAVVPKYLGRLEVRSEVNFKMYTPHQAQWKSLPKKVSFPIKSLWDRQRKWDIIGVTSHFLFLIFDTSSVPAFQLTMEDLIQIPWKGLGPTVWMNILISQVCRVSSSTVQVSEQWAELLLQRGGWGCCLGPASSPV